MKKKKNSFLEGSTKAYFRGERKKEGKEGWKAGRQERRKKRKKNKEDRKFVSFN